MTSELKSLLLVDDDDDLRKSLGEKLKLLGEFEVHVSETGMNAIKILEHKKFDIILLDVGLPDSDGREVCRTLRRKGIKCPIIMLTGTDTESDTILALDAGADDYITKPFNINILLARLRTHLAQENAH